MNIADLLESVSYENLKLSLDLCGIKYYKYSEKVFVLNNDKDSIEFLKRLKQFPTTDTSIHNLKEIHISLINYISYKTRNKPFFMRHDYLIKVPIDVFKKL